LTLTEYAAALEKSRRPGDAAIARYIRTHKQRIECWLLDAGFRLSRSDREDLTQVAMLAIAQVVSAPDADTALNRVQNAIHNESRQKLAWNSRKSTIPDEDEES